MDKLENDLHLLILEHRDWSGDRMYGDRCYCGWENKYGWEDWPEHFAKVLAEAVRNMK